jgi:hypothetical protein
MEHEDPIRPIPTRDQDAMTPERAEEIAAKRYAQLRAYSDRTLAQIVIADGAVEVAERAMGLTYDRDGRYPLADVEVAARLAADAQELLNATVLAARLAGKSWDAIGEAVTGESGKKQTMSNRYGHLEDEWQNALLEPVEVNREDWGGRGSVTYNAPEALDWTDLGDQVRRLQRFLDKHCDGRDLGLPDDIQRPTTGIADYLWRLNAAIEKYAFTTMPTALAADLDARKQKNLAEGQAYMDAAERAAGRADHDL